MDAGATKLAAHLVGPRDGEPQQENDEENDNICELKQSLEKGYDKDAHLRKPRRRQHRAKYAEHAKHEQRRPHPAEQRWAVRSAQVDDEQCGVGDEEANVDEAKGVEVLSGSKGDDVESCLHSEYPSDGGVEPH